MTVDNRKTTILDCSLFKPYVTVKEKSNASNHMRSFASSRLPIAAARLAFPLLRPLMLLLPVAPPFLFAVNPCIVGRDCKGILCKQMPETLENGCLPE